MFFSNTHWPQLTAPFYSILFETSICQFNSSKFSPIMPDEVREHLTRDQRHSFIQNLSRSFRFTASSLQFTSLIFYRVQVRGLEWPAEAWFCAQWPIFVLYWGLCLDYCMVGRSNMAHYKISNRVSHLLIFLSLVFDRMHDAMYLNKMSRTSSRNIGPQH